MQRSIHARGCAAATFLGLMLALGGGCTDSTGLGETSSTPGPTGPARSSTTTRLSGSIRVVVTTSGTNPDSDGYELAFDDTMHVAMTVNDTLSFSKAPATGHVFDLLGLAPNCAPDSTHRQLVLKSGEAKEITYSIWTVAPARSGGHTVPLRATAPDIPGDDR